MQEYSQDSPEEAVNVGGWAVVVVTAMVVGSSEGGV